MTSWHANGPLDEALFFFVNCAFPTEVFEREWKHRIVLTVGNNDWAEAAVDYLKKASAGVELA